MVKSYYWQTDAVDDELLLEIGWATRGVKSYFQVGLLTEILIIANLRQASSKIWFYSWQELSFLLPSSTIKLTFPYPIFCTFVLCYKSTIKFPAVFANIFFSTVTLTTNTISMVSSWNKSYYNLGFCKKLSNWLFLPNDIVSYPKTCEIIWSKIWIVIGLA